MTWTRELTVDGPATFAADDHDAPGAELAPGVTVERRSLFWLPAALAAAVLFGRRPAAAAADGGAKGPADARLGWDVFVRECRAVAAALFKDATASGQDAYLLRLGALAVRLKDQPPGEVFPYGKLEPKVEFGPSYRGTPFVIIQWRMQPRAVLPAHCHPGASVCTLGLAGEARLRNFEVEGAAPAYDSGSSERFLIRETHSQVLTAGRVNTLSSVRDNIHYFEAGPEGARGIDITTPYRGDGSFSFVAFDPERPTDARRRVFEATWKGMKP